MVLDSPKYADDRPCGHDVKLRAKMKALLLLLCVRSLVQCMHGSRWIDPIRKEMLSLMMQLIIRYNIFYWLFLP